MRSVAATTRSAPQNTGEVLSIVDCSTNNGADVVTWPYFDECQQWHIHPADAGYYRVTARVGGRGLDVKECAPDSYDVIVWPYRGANCQQWQIERVE